MKIFVLSRKTGILYLIMLISLAALMLVGKNAAVTTSSQNRDLPVYCVDKKEKEVALSFDAAWGNEDTEDLIEIMNKYGVKTTFFVVGGWVDKYPESIKQLADAGHEIMNHSNTHPHMTQLSAEEMKKEISECDAKIEKLTKVKPTLFRAPYGDYNNSVIQTVRETGHQTIQWDVDSLDWKNLSPGEIKERVLSKVQPGSIILFHNAALHTPEALPEIIENLQSDGYKIVKVSELVMRENYKIDPSGKQIKVE